MFNLGLKSEEYDKYMIADLVILKSAILCNFEKPLATEEIIEILAENSPKFSKIYYKLISNYIKNGDKEIFKSLPGSNKNMYWKAYGRILFYLEDFNPSELIDQITTLQDAVLQNNVSRGIVLVERKANLLMVISTISVFAVLINFSVVVVFMDALEIMKNAF